MPDISATYQSFKGHRLENGIFRADRKLTGWNDVIIHIMLRSSRDNLISPINKLDPNAEPDWVLLKVSYYAAMFHDNDLPKYVTFYFYSNF